LSDKNPPDRTVLLKELCPFCSPAFYFDFSYKRDQGLEPFCGYAESSARCPVFSQHVRFPMPMAYFSPPPSRLGICWLRRVTPCPGSIPPTPRGANGSPYRDHVPPLRGDNGRLRRLWFFDKVESPRCTPERPPPLPPPPLAPAS